MSDLSVFHSPAATMSSLEIATLVESNHADVRRTIVRLAERDVISLPPLAEVKIQRERREESVGVYHLDKRSSLIVVAQLCPEFTARIVDRWQQLEAEAADPMRILGNPAAMRGLLLGYTEKVIALETQVGELTPKAEALDRIARADGSMCVTNAAKDLQVRPKDLFAWLQAHQWIYRRQGGAGWLAYQDRIQSGLLEHKVTVVERSDGSSKVLEQVLVTSKGLTRLAVLLRKDGMVMGEAA